MSAANQPHTQFTNTNNYLITVSLQSHTITHSQFPFTIRRRFTERFKLNAEMITLIMAQGLRSLIQSMSLSLITAPQPLPLMAEYAQIQHAKILHSREAVATIRPTLRTMLDQNPVARLFSLIVVLKIRDRQS